MNSTNDLLNRARNLLQILIAHTNGNTGFEAATDELVSEITAELGDDPKTTHHLGSLSVNQKA